MKCMKIHSLLFRLMRVKLSRRTIAAMWEFLFLNWQKYIHPHHFSNPSINTLWFNLLLRLHISKVCVFKSVLFALYTAYKAYFQCLCVVRRNIHIYNNWQRTRHVMQTHAGKLFLTNFVFNMKHNIITRLTWYATWALT